MGFLSRWKEKKKQKLAEQQELAEQRQRQIRVWQTEDLSQYAAKIDGLILKKNEYGYLAIPELLGMKIVLGLRELITLVQRHLFIL